MKKSAKEVKEQRHPKNDRKKSEINLAGDMQLCLDCIIQASNISLDAWGWGLHVEDYFIRILSD